MTMQNYWNLLLCLCLGGFAPLKTRAAEDTAKSVILYTPYTKVSVPPGESIDYTIDVINKSDQVRNAAISVVGIPNGWSCQLKAGGLTISQLSVLPDEKKSFSLKVDVPLKVNKGTYRFTVSANDLGELPLTVIVSEQGTYQTEFTTTQPNMQGNSRSTFTFSTTLKNRTAEQQLYALMANAPRGWNVSFKPNYQQATSAQVAANATENISIDVNPPANIEAGTYKISVRATTNATSAELTLEVVITGTYQMELSTPRGLLSADITAGSAKNIELVVRNAGSSELKDIELTANKPIDWEVVFNPAKIEQLKAGETKQVIANVKASKKALPGDYATKMDARTPEVSSTAEFRISVKTPAIWGWLGILIILSVLGGVYFLIRKYGRR